MKTQKNKHQKFLEFNGKKILFCNADGIYWIALKPILDALNMDSDRAIKTLKKDPILAPERSIQPVQVSKNGKKQLRNMTCLPEMYIYGWIFSLRSDSEELINYKRTCYKLIFDHFHGVITNRKDLLIERTEVETKIHKVSEHLKTKSKLFGELKALKSQKTALNKKLNSIDEEVISQKDLFEELPPTGVN